MLRFSGAGVSDTGLVRPDNEDSAFVGPYVALVADGVGGAAAGEVASATAAYAMTATALAHFGGEPEGVLLEGAEAARASIRRSIQGDLNRLGMATTLTAVKRAAGALRGCISLRSPIATSAACTTSPATTIRAWVKSSPPNAAQKT